MARTAIAALLLVSVSSSAEETPGPTCDPNLKPFQETEDQKTIRLTCETHVGCRMFFAYVRTTCNAANFLRKLKDKITPGKPLDNDAVAEATLDDYPRSTAGDTALSNAREAGRLTPNGKTIKDTFKTNGGSEAYREVQDNATFDAKGNFVTFPGTSRGTIIYSSGTIVRGTLKNNYAVNDIIGNEPMGVGQVIWPQGHTKAGDIDENFKVSGPSAWTGTDANGMKSMLEGTFLKDLPDGEMVRRYSDGRARRERWSKGQLLKIGEMSGPDGIPPPLGDVQIPLPPGPYWEGVNSQNDADRWRKFLSCNGKVVAIGPFYPQWPAKPVDPDPAFCPNPETYRNGFVLVFGPNDTKRDEFWCDGLMIASTAWKATGPFPSLPANVKCQDPIPEPDEEEIAEAPDPKEPEMINGRPRAIAAGLPFDPLIVSGPPWPCPAELDAYLTAQGHGSSQQNYWSSMYYKPVVVFLTSLTRRSDIVSNAHQQYVLSVSSAQSQPVAFNINGSPYYEGFFRNRRAMLSFSSALEAARPSEPQGGVTERLMGFHACLARYLAANART